MRRIGTMCLSVAVINDYHERFTKVTKPMVAADGADHADRGHVDSMGHTYMPRREMNCDYGYLPMNCGLGPNIEEKTD
jgi:hypothetical protein